MCEQCMRPTKQCIVSFKQCLNSAQCTGPRVVRMHQEKKGDDAEVQTSLTKRNPNTHLICIWIATGSWAFTFSSFFSFFLLRSAPSGGTLSVTKISKEIAMFNRSRALFMGLTNFFFQQFSLKINLTVLFIHLKIILLQYFQFSAK